MDSRKNKLFSLDSIGKIFVILTFIYLPFAVIGGSQMGGYEKVGAFSAPIILFILGICLIKLGKKHN